MKALPKPNLRINTLANYVGTGVLVFLSLLTVPFFLNYLGAEAFGLIGFLLVLQNVFAVFDLGFSQLVSRQIAKARADDDFVALIELLKSVEFYFLFFLLGISILGIFFSNWFANFWFGSKNLELALIENSLITMLVVIGIQSFIRLYRMGILGSEAQVWVSFVSISFGILRYLGSLVFVVYISQNIFHYFLFQLAVLCLEAMTYAFRLYFILPVQKKIVPRFSWRTLKEELPLSISLCLASLIWGITSQYDKLLMSSVLTLEHFGFFTIITLLASGSIYIALPIRQAVQPRITRLLAENNEQEAITLYRKASHYALLLSSVLVSFLCFFGDEVIFIWTRDETATEFIKPLLTIFCLGGLYYAPQTILVGLKVAYGKLKTHLITNALFLSCQLPILFYIASFYSIFEFGLAWFVLRTIFFFTWSLLLHNSVSHSLHPEWLFKDSIPTISSIFITAFCLKQLVSVDLIAPVYAHFFIFLFVFSAIALAGAITSHFTWSEVRRLYRSNDYGSNEST